MSLPSLASLVSRNSPKTNINDIQELLSLIIARDILLDPEPCDRINELCSRVSPVWKAACADHSLFESLNVNFGWYGPRGTIEAVREMNAPYYAIAAATPRTWFAHVCKIKRALNERNPSLLRLPDRIDPDSWIKAILQDKTSYMSVSTSIFFYIAKYRQEMEERFATPWYLNSMEFKDWVADFKISDTEQVENTIARWRRLVNLPLDDIIADSHLNKDIDPVVRAVHASLQFASTLRSDIPSKIRNVVTREAKVFIEQIKTIYTKLVQISSADSSAPYLSFVVGVGTAALRLNELDDFEFVDGSSRLAEMGISEGFHGFFRKKGTNPTPSEVSSDDDEEEDDEEDEDEEDEEEEDEEEDDDEGFENW